jgi:hypothetical protein
VDCIASAFRQESGITSSTARPGLHAKKWILRKEPFLPGNAVIEVKQKVTSVRQYAEGRQLPNSFPFLAIKYHKKGWYFYTYLKITEAGTF